MGKPESDQRARLIERDGECCMAVCSQNCNGRPQHRHHLVGKGVGGSDDDENLIMVCGWCHDWIHNNSRLARLKGLKRDP